MNGDLGAVSQQLAEVLRPATDALDRAGRQLASVLAPAGPLPGPPLAAAVPTIAGPPPSGLPPPAVPAIAAALPIAPAPAPPVFRPAPPPPAGTTVVRELGEAVSSRIVESSSVATERLTTVLPAPPVPAGPPVTLAPALQAYVVPASQSLGVQSTQPRLPGPTPLAPALQPGSEPVPVVPRPLPAPAPAPAPAAPPAAPAERIIRVPEPAPAPTTANEVEVSGQVTINGGLNVQITAETVDLEHAEETARVIAEDVLEAIERLVERDRFRRGLATGQTA